MKKIWFIEMGLRSTLIIGTVSGLIICLTIVAIAFTLEYAAGGYFVDSYCFIGNTLINLVS